MVFIPGIILVAIFFVFYMIAVVQEAESEW